MQMHHACLFYRSSTLVGATTNRVYTIAHIHNFLRKFVGVGCVGGLHVELFPMHVCIDRSHLNEVPDFFCIFQELAFTFKQLELLCIMRASTGLFMLEQEP